MADQAKVDAVMRDVEAKQQESSELLDKLRKSRAIESLWPTAFARGKVRTYWYGTRRRNMRWDENPNKGLQFCIEDADGRTERFDFRDVPEVLGGGGS